MDVTCERCGTEYEFDETLVSERGTTVKCTQCGHLFKVYRPGSGSEPWRVRRGDGSEQRIGTLRELQQLITRGELTPEDLISRGGEGWKRLGDIAELAGFFRTAGQPASEAQPGSTGALDRTLPAMERPAGGADPASAAWEAMPTVPGGRTYKRTAMGLGAPAPVPPPASPSAEATAQGMGAPPAAPAPAASATAGTAPERPAAKAAVPRVPTGALPTPEGGWVDGPGLAEGEEGPTVRDQARSAGPALPRLDEQPAAPVQPSALPRAGAGAPPPAASASAPTVPATDPPPSERPPSEFPEVPGLPKRRGGALRWVVLLVLLGGLGAAGYQFRDRWLPLLQGGEAADPVARFLEAGDEALAEDHPDAYERALREYTKASAVVERDPRVLARMALAEALHALALELHATDLEALAKQDPSRAGEARALRREAKRRTQEALRLASQASASKGGRAMPPVLLARATAAFVAGDGEDGDAALAELRKADPEGLPGAVAWLEALRSVDPQKGVGPEALEPARRAVAEAPDSVRARLLLARAALAARRIEEANEALEAVLARHPDHPEARALRAAIEAGRPPAPPLVQAADGGAEHADAGTPTPAASPEPPGEPAAPSEAPTATARERSRDREPRSGGGAPAGDYDALVRKGEQLQERGRSGEARRYFERALQLRPNGPEALVGLGYVAADQGRLGEALGYFRRAAARGYGEGYFGLGEVYEDMGRKQEALDAFRSYLRRSPSGPSAVIARRKVADLERELGERAAAGTDRAPGDGQPEQPGGTEPAGRAEQGGGAANPPEAPAEEPAPSAPEGPAPGGAAPPGPTDRLPAPRGTDPSTLPSSDPPAVDSEP